MAKASTKFVEAFHFIVLNPVFALGKRREGEKRKK